MCRVHSICAVQRASSELSIAARRPLRRDHSLQSVELLTEQQKHAINNYLKIPQLSPSLPVLYLDGGPKRTTTVSDSPSSDQTN